MVDDCSWHCFDWSLLVFDKQKEMKLIKDFFKPRKHSLNPRCYFCNKFMSYKEMGTNSVSWTPHGGYDWFEPPDPEWAHFDCWNNLPEKRRSMITRDAWIAPQIRIDETQEYVNDLKQIRRQQNES